MKQSLSLQIPVNLSILSRNTNNNCGFDSSASVQMACEPMLSSYLLLVIAQNKHEWTSESMLKETIMV